MVNFADLKKNRNDSFTKLNDQLQKLNTSFNNDDGNFWKPDVDKAGNGFAILRFLPSPAGEDMPFIRIYDHGFQGPGGWYIENSLTTLGSDDPVSEYNTQLWNSGVESNKEIVRKQKRRLSYTSNVYIVSDPAHPENEGKVFLYKYGKKIFEKLNDLMNPKYPGEIAVNPFDLWEGANFQLKIRNYEGYRNYDKSEFAKPAPLLQSDDDMETVWKTQHSLKELVDPKNFKTYVELKAKLYKVLALDGSKYAPTGRAAEDDSSEMNFTPNFKERSAPQAEESSSPSQPTKFVADDDDDDMSFFKNLADD
jgi:hypothetical protein